MLAEAGHEVAAAVGDADALTDAVATERPDLAVIGYPELPMLLLSQHVESRHSVELVAAGGFGYLLKDRVLQVQDFLDVLERVAAAALRSIRKLYARYSPRLVATIRSALSQPGNARCLRSPPKAGRTRRSLER